MCHRSRNATALFVRWDRGLRLTYVYIRGQLTFPDTGCRVAEEETLFQGVSTEERFEDSTAQCLNRSV